MALSARSQLAMLCEDSQVAIELGMRAVTLARKLDDAEIISHGLTNLGTATFFRPGRRARARADRGGRSCWPPGSAKTSTRCARW